MALAATIALAAANSAFAAPRAAAIPGGIAIVEVAPARARAPQVFYEDRPVLVEKRGGHWQALVGLALTATPGEHRIRIVSAGPTGVDEHAKTFRVAPHDYPTQRLTIRDTSKVTPPPEALARIEREQQRMAELRARFREAAEADTSLTLPAQGRLSSRFGLRRILNGEPRNPHGGLDLAIGAGTPLVAPSPGVVVEAADFYYCGNTVVIDHGQGLLSTYCHLQRIDVSIGQTLRRGEAIGLSGASGRATGPHLHWSVYLNGNAIDPELLLDSARR